MPLIYIIFSTLLINSAVRRTVKRCSAAAGARNGQQLRRRQVPSSVLFRSNPIESKRELFPHYMYTALRCRWGGAAARCAGEGSHSLFSGKIWWMGGVIVDYSIGQKAFADWLASGRIGVAESVVLVVES